MTTNEFQKILREKPDDEKNSAILSRNPKETLYSRLVLNKRICVQCRHQSRNSI